MRHVPQRPEWLADHRAVWARKSALRAVYRAWFATLHQACAPGNRILEVGCGPGFFKELYGDVIATDLVANPFADCQLDASRLPFRDGAIGSVVLLDVFHHLADPDGFLREAARVLRPRGRLVMIEPWLGFAGRIFWRYLHHEACDPRVDPTAWKSHADDPMAGNSALPYVYFRPGGRLGALAVSLRVAHLRVFAALPWLLSGGFQPYSFLPGPMVRACDKVDQFLSRWPAATGMRCLVVLENRS